MNARRTLLALVAVAVSGACSTRGYRAPETPSAALVNVAPALFTAQAYDPRWWQQFEDPVLDQLESRAVASNLDVAVAVARVRQARAVFDDVALDRFPTAEVGASVDRRSQVVPGFTQDPVATSTYRAGFDAFWEIDLFGRVRSSMQAASATAASLAATLDEVRVSVAAEVARNYFELRGLQQQLGVAERSLANQRETLRVTTVRRDAGIGEELDVARAAAQVAAIEASVPPLRAAAAARLHRLAVLNGVRPGALATDLAPRAYLPIAKALPLGDAGQLLQRRPDIRAAERRVAAATAREGVARADLFPRVSISGFLGLIAGRGSLFGKADSRAWAVTPALSWAGSDIGSARARVRGAKAGTEEVVADYDQTVLRALEETENALVAYREEQERLVKLTDQARESGRAAGIARARYREGVADFLSLLDAERTELQAQDAVAQAEAGVYTAVVAVYKSFGGIIQ